MKRIIIKFEAVLLLTSIVIASSGCGGGTTSNTVATNATANVASKADNTSNISTTEAERFSEDELDELLARVALYPDPILAQVIPASTYVDQLKEAQGTLNGSTDDARIDDQNWDVSVKSVAHYPTVLKMMVDNEDWTTSLGQAYVLQPDDVTKCIQRLRAQAMDVGNLVSGPQQQVLEKGDVIRIEPAQPKVIYVPQYNSETVYTEPAKESDSGVSTGAVIATAAVAFGVGLLIGSWLNNDYDYYGRGIYYHGWAGPGWVSVNRSYVNVNRSVYVNNSYRNINVNRNIVYRGAPTYRRDLTLNSGLRRDRVTNARINNLNVAPNGRLRTNAGRHTGQNDLKNIDRNRINNDLPRGNAGDRDPVRNRPASPKVNSGNRNLGGNRPSAAPRSAPSRSAPSVQRQRTSPSGGGRRR